MKPLPKGPAGTLLAGSADEFKDNPLEFLISCQNQFGNVVPFRVGPFPALFINEPDLIHEVLVSKSANFTKDAAIKNNPKFFGQGLLSSEGEYWKQQRKLAAPAFNHKRLEDYGQIMVDHTDAMLKDWSERSSIELQHEMMKLTLGIAAKTLFDVDLGHDNTELEKALTEAQQYLAIRINDPLFLMFPEWVPFPTNLSLTQAINVVDKFIYKLIEQRRHNLEGRGDLLSVLMSVRDEESGAGMSDKQVRDEVFTLFFAGHETTAVTLTWTLYLLSQHPDVEEKLRAELQEVLQGRRPAAADYPRLAYTERVIKESMRVRPPVWAIGREAEITANIGDFTVQKGTAVIISQWTMHHDQRFYESPHVFNPDRWTNEFTQALPKFAYMPFGGGPRTCIGNGFAMLEGVLALACIMQDFHLDSLPNHRVELLPAITLRPTHGIPMKLCRR